MVKSADFGRMRSQERPTDSTSPSAASAARIEESADGFEPGRSMRGGPAVAPPAPPRISPEQRNELNAELARLLSGRNRDLDRILAQIDAGADPDTVNADGVSAIKLAAAFGSSEHITRLLQAGVKPNAKALLGIAADANNIPEVLKGLQATDPRDASATAKSIWDSNLKPNSLYTLGVLFSEQKTPSPVMQELLKLGLANAPARLRMTILHELAKNGDLDESHLESLLKAGADINNPSPSTPLSFAVVAKEKGLGNNLNTLLKNGADPSQISLPYRNTSPLTLLEHADMSLVKPEYMAPFAASIVKRWFEHFSENDEFLKHFYNFALKGNSAQRTLASEIAKEVGRQQPKGFFHLLMQRYPQTAPFISDLNKQGVLDSVQDKKGNTFLHHQIENFPRLQSLLESGVSPYIKNKAGQTVMDQIMEPGRFTREQQDTLIRAASGRSLAKSSSAHALDLASGSMPARGDVSRGATLAGDLIKGDVEPLNQALREHNAEPLTVEQGMNLVREQIGQLETLELKPEERKQLLTSFAENLVEVYKIPYARNNEEFVSFARNFLSTLTEDDLEVVKAVFAEAQKEEAKAAGN